ncbi:alpha/beta fold hydrolase [Rhizobium leguminosarum]|uniref:alpha/beta fold hydrolase n=2 Tax=Rhizobium TaxID=379 RepID=UPI001C839D34|nr:alpha/beta hydrolase [Rhizobium leguminosarum]MBX4917489.1 alpha/beta hydrolase [Rhizobium bangladeshense]MBY5700231.1 alpha/beta hydrolase [Rhizobium leguminosarum]
MLAELCEDYLTPRVIYVNMSDGRTIRAYEVGPPDVPLVIGIHGTPSTGLSHVVNYVATAPIFCRLVAFDRPGYGGSTPLPGRKVSDVALVVEAVLDHLAVDRAAVYGHSGGGMLALATAALLPKRILRAACSAGNGPNSSSTGFDYTKGQSRLMREEITEARKGPQASREFYRRVAARLRDQEIERQLYSANDLRVERLLAPLVDQIAQKLALAGTPYSEEDAYVDDAQSWASPWGFDLESITVPTRFFHGLEDIMVSRHHSEWMKSQVPNSSLELFPHYGHHLTQLMPHILAWLVSDSMLTQHSANSERDKLSETRFR